MRRLVVICLLAGVTAIVSAYGAPPPPRLVSKPPDTLRAGAVWVVTVRPSQPVGVMFQIRQSARRASFALRPRAGVSRANVVFPRPGVWSYGVLQGGRFIRLGATHVHQRTLVLREPFDVIEAGGGIVVSDRRAGAVFQLDAASGAWRRIATVLEARELAPLDDRTVLVTSGNRVLRLGLLDGSLKEVARAEDVILGLERAADGSLYVAEGGSAVTHVGSTGERRVLVRRRDGIHGLLLDGARLVAAESFAGKVLAIDRATGDVRQLADGLGNPSFVSPAPNGALYVSEFSAGRISLLRPDGSRSAVATVASVGAIWVRSDGSLLAVTLGGDLVRINPTTGAVRTLLR